MPLNAGGGASKTQCPAAESLAAYADGRMNAERRGEIERHLVSCASCRTVLREVSMFAESGEGSGAGSIEHKPRRMPPWTARVALAAAAGIVLFIAATQLFWRATMNESGSWLEAIGLSTSTDTLIARAYADQRTVELRIPGGAYAPLRVERSAGSVGSRNRSADLLEADLRVTKGLAGQPDSIALQQQKSRIELMNWDYSPALARLSRLSRENPERVDLLLDLALAHFERGMAEPGREIDLGEALDTLTEVLAKRPDDGVALFNRGVVEQRLMLFREAERDFQRFLEIDGGGDWSAEARERLHAVRQALQQRAARAKDCELLTAQLVSEWASPAVVASRVEAYEGGFECLRRSAATKWLPATFDGAEGPADPLAEVAFGLAARTFEQVTNDTWLTDLARYRRPDAEPAARALADAMNANAVVDAARGLAAASTARALFARSGNRAGWAQASIEYVYATRRTQDRTGCRELFQTIVPALQDSRWRWTILQGRLEEASCLSMAGNRGAALQLARDTVVATDSAATAGLHLRALSYVQALESMIGDVTAAWSDGLRALRLYWNGTHAPVWGYQVHFEVASVAAAAGQPHTALHFKRATLAEIEGTRRPLIEAFSAFELAKTAVAAGEPLEARRAFDRAAKLFQQLPQDRALVAALVETEISLADLEMTDGASIAALQRLHKVEPQMSAIDSYPVRYAFARALARAARLSGSDDKDRRLQALVNVANEGFRSLRTFDDQMDWSKRAAEGYRWRVANLALDQGKVDAALDAWESYRAAPMQHTIDAIDRTTAGSSSVTQFLPARGAADALIYVVLDDRTLIWHVSDGRSQLHVVNVTRETLATLTRRLVALCASPESPEADIRTAARELGRYLLDTIQTLPSSGTLWIELDEPLDGLPFSVVSRASGVPIGNTHALVQMRAAGLAAPRHPRGGGDPRPVFLSVGLSKAPAVPQMPPLPDAIDEARTVASLHPESHVLLNEAATLKRVTASLSQASAFHFAGHSWTASGRPSLLVWPEGDATAPTVIGADTITRLDLRRLSLVMLSACAVDAADVSGHASAVGLVPAFLRAGAAMIIATRWNLDSTVARSFSGQLYRDIRRGSTPAQAVRAAAAAIRSQPSTRHPYFWAGYQLYAASPHRQE